MEKREDSPRIGLLLLDAGEVTSGGLEAAVEEQPHTSLLLGELLIERGEIDDRALVRALARQWQIPMADLRTERPDPEAIAVMDGARAHGFQVVPLRIEAGRLDVAVAEPRDERLRRFLTGLPVDIVRLHLAVPSEIRATLRRIYPAIGRSEMGATSFAATVAERTEVAPPLKDKSAEDAAVAELMDQILTQAVRDRASDVHIEPMNDRDRVRFRIDGALQEKLTIPPKMGQALIGRIRALAAGTDGTRPSPDGQFRAAVDDHQLDVRVSATSTIWGEKIVLRLLDKSRPLKGLAELGFSGEQGEEYGRAVRAPYGMVIVSGPTGSGKTTTLYATLKEIDRDEINIMTIEDPVEYVFPTFNQIQLDEKGEVSFASGLKAILRQDPNVILVGEVRDSETARIAFESAQTGHMVLTSMHATDSVAAIFRLIDMGIDRPTVASSIVSVVAQRLVRRVCHACKTRYDPTPEELATWSSLGGGRREEWVRGRGCNVCGHTGYYERIGVFELLVMTDEIQRALIAGAGVDEIRERARSQGLRTLRREAIRLASANITTTEEVVACVAGTHPLSGSVIDLRDEPVESDAPTLTDVPRRDQAAPPPDRRIVDFINEPLHPAGKRTQEVAAVPPPPPPPLPAAAFGRSGLRGRTGPDTDSAQATDPDTEDRTGPDTDSAQATDPDTEDRTEPDTDSEQATDPDTEDRTEPDTDSEQATDPDTEDRTEPDTDTAQATNPDTEDRTEPDTDTAQATNPDTEDRTEPDTDSAQATNPDTEDRTEPDTDSEQATDPDTEDRTEPDTDSEQATDPDTEDRTEPDTDSEQATDPDTEDRTEPDTDSEQATDPDTEDRTEPDTDSAQATNPDTEDRSEREPETEEEAREPEDATEPSFQAVRTRSSLDRPPPRPRRPQSEGPRWRSSGPGGTPAPPAGH